MNRKTRTILMALGISLVAAVATQARAEEQSYYKGKSWEVLLNTPNTAGERLTARCVAAIWQKNP
ncbi:hypothetical protein [Rhizobium rhizogenes]|uniref:hypothetical protein n=1 Tax=Rhizobium rhizogenes TaxID=359 RepID=UPI001056F5C1|nr:hypothetical protein [Rhizobium rhizogenes]